MDYTVYVDSNNRNQTLYPNANSYTLHLATPILNITKAEVVSAMLPSMPASEFVALDILELKTVQNQTADALKTTTVTSNSYNGNFAILPVKVSGTFEFYNQNYRIMTKYTPPIDKLDRLTITWRQPNNGNPYYNGGDIGRNMFLLRFETADGTDGPERPFALPDPVPWDSGERNRIFIIGFVAVAGLLIIMSMQRKVQIRRESLATLKSE